MSLFNQNSYYIGIISDTHGLLRPSVYEAFKNVDAIFHAGDVGGTVVLNELKKIAPVTAVRGNTDGGDFGQMLKPVEAIQINQNFIYMLHNLNDLDLDPSGGKFQMIISGHTHQPKIFKKDGVLFLNPGSAGPRRYDYPISVAVLRIEDSVLNPKILHIDP